MKYYVKNFALVLAIIALLTIGHELTGHWLSFVLSFVGGAALGHMAIRLSKFENTDVVIVSDPVDYIDSIFDEEILKEIDVALEPAIHAWYHRRMRELKLTDTKYDFEVRAMLNIPAQQP
jgi:hypothetical protein